MNVPDILGVDVITPDGRGSVLCLHMRRVTVLIYTIERGQVMQGLQSGTGSMHYSYKYEDVEIIKGRYCFNEERIRQQYNEITNISDLLG